MKHIIITALFILLGITQISAQPAKKAENFEQFQLKIIVNLLDIEESKVATFEKIYSQYTSEIAPLSPKHEREEKRPSDEVVEAQILESFEISRKITDIKEKYYKRFRTVLTPHQILRMYNIERRLNERINSEVENRTEGNKPTKASK